MNGQRTGKWTDEDGCIRSQIVYRGRHGSGRVNDINLRHYDGSINYKLRKHTYTSDYSKT